MAFTEPSHAHEMLWRFSPKKQNTIGTALSDGNLPDSALVNGYDVGKLAHRLISNADRMGKGHPYATSQRRVARMISLARNVELNDLFAGWAAAFCLGDVSSAQPDAINNPTVYDHTITWSSMATSKAMPFTTIHEKPWAGLARKLLDMVVAGFTLSGRGQDPVALAISMLGSGRATDVALPAPTLTDLNYLDNGGAIIKLGASGGAVDISSRVIDWSVAVAANPDEANGRYPSTGEYVGRWWYGPKRTAIPELTLFVQQDDADLLDLFRNDTARELQINCAGAVITGGEPEIYRMDMLWPEIHFTAVDDVIVDGKMALRMTVGEDGVFQKAASEYFQITVTNKVVAYLAGA